MEPDAYTSMPHRDYSTGPIKKVGLNPVAGSQSDLQSLSERIANLVGKATELSGRQQDFVTRAYGPRPEEAGSGGKAVPLPNGAFGQAVFGVSLLEDLMNTLHIQQSTIERLA